MTAKIRILFLASSPSNRARLRLDEEARAIDDRIRRSEHREAIEVISKWAVRPQDLQQALLQYRPHIVHFSGHGQSDGIVLEGDDGKAHVVDGAALARIFKTLKDNIRVVVMNACHSAEQARALTRHIDIAVGMPETTTDSAAIAFSAFYMGLGYGRSVETAFEIGINEINLAGGVAGGDPPVLWLRDGVDASAVVLIDGTSPAPSDSNTAPSRPPASESAPSGLPANLTGDLEPLRKTLHGSKNAVVPFVGSGLSRPALPSWYGFVKSLISRASPGSRAELEALLDRGCYLDVASLLERDPMVGKPIIAQAIQQAFRRPKHPRPEVYDLVAKLPTEHFLTTNYDPWLKEAVAQHAALPRVYIPADANALADLAPGSPPLVLMLHGDADRAEHCVLSARSYRQLQHGMPAFKHAMSALASQRTFLFLGYSLSDPDIAAVLDEWAEIFAPDGAAPRHVMLGAGFSKIDHMTLLDRSVRPVDYSPQDASDHHLLPAILRWLATPP